MISGYGGKWICQRTSIDAGLAQDWLIIVSSVWKQSAKFTGFFGASLAEERARWNETRRWEGGEGCKVLEMAFGGFGIRSQINEARCGNYADATDDSSHDLIFFALRSCGVKRGFGYPLVSCLELQGR